jgi:hypothetical protein
MVYTVFTDKARNDLPIPPTCQYQTRKFTTAAGRVGFRVEYDCTTTKPICGLRPRINDATNRAPTLEIAYQQLLWKSRLAGPFVSVWRSWTRALRWARYLQKRGATHIVVHAVDLDAINTASHPIYDASEIIKELHRRQRGQELVAKNHVDELIVYNGIPEHFGAIVASLPAGGENTKVQTYFATLLIPQELKEEIDRYARENERQVAVETPHLYYRSAYRSGSVPKEDESFFDSVLSRLFLEMMMSKGFVDEAKLLQLVMAMSVNFHGGRMAKSNADEGMATVSTKGLSSPYVAPASSEESPEGTPTPTPTTAVSSADLQSMWQTYGKLATGQAAAAAATAVATGKADVPPDSAVDVQGMWDQIREFRKMSVASMGTLEEA